jgi:hypothetical protein
LTGRLLKNLFSATGGAAHGHAAVFSGTPVSEKKKQSENHAFRFAD